MCDETHATLRPESKSSLTFLDEYLMFLTHTQPLYGPPSNVQGGA